ncbi:hypothetical protein [Streptomyces sp. NPDC058698]|uniref:hypothetical protein n=1 Tax=Streptomyces sp. NPDC058698 TaxID=3346606 RepID=UPI00364B8B4F
MSDPADPAGADQTSSCCAAIAELRQRAEQRATQHTQADGSEDTGTFSPDPVRDA